jgi:hypothetical protein
MGAVGAFGVSVTVGGELQILVLGLRRLEPVVLGPALQRRQRGRDLVGVDLHAPIERGNATPLPPVDVRLRQPADTDKYVDGSGGSPFGQSCLSDSRDSCFQVCHDVADIMSSVRRHTCVRSRRSPIRS